IVRGVAAMGVDAPRVSRGCCDRRAGGGADGTRSCAGRGRARGVERGANDRALAAPGGTTKVLQSQGGTAREDVAELSPLGAYARGNAGDAAVAPGDGRGARPALLPGSCRLLGRGRWVGEGAGQREVGGGSGRGRA